jgi:hypothetical protein
VRGYIEHDSVNCLLGEHSNRGRVRDMCPVFLELRRLRIRATMREARRYARLVNYREEVKRRVNA